MVDGPEQRTADLVVTAQQPIGDRQPHQQPRRGPDGSDAASARCRLVMDIE
jgi:hypothetical protein